MDFNYEKLFKLHSTIMRMNRCHPDIFRDRKWFVTFLLMHTSFTVAFALIIYNIVYNLKANDIFKACKDGTLMVVYLVNTFQYIVMLWKQEQIKTLINIMKEDYNKIRQAKIGNQDMVYKYAQNGAWVTKLWFLLCYYGALMFPIKNIVVYSYYHLVEDEFRLIPMYELIYPDFIHETLMYFTEDEKNTVLIMYIVTYVVTLFFAFYSASIYTSFVPLGSIFMLHACGHMEILTRRMDYLFVKQEGEEIMDELKSIVVELQEIYSFVNRIDDTFQLAYDFTLKATSIIMPITIYEVIEGFRAGEVSLEFITFIVGGALISSSPCYYSEKLMDKGEQLRLSVYNCGWERHFNRRIRSTIVLILQRALRPLALHTMFRTICLDALTEVSNQAYTIFNLMNTMWN